MSKERENIRAIMQQVRIREISNDLNSIETCLRYLTSRYTPHYVDRQKMYYLLDYYMKCIERQADE